MLIALWLRGASLPTRGELVEKRLPAAPRPQHLVRPAVIADRRRRRAADRAAVRLSQALMLSMVGMVICLSFVVITGFVGQVSLAQVDARRRVRASPSRTVVTELGHRLPVGALAGIAWRRRSSGCIVGVSALRVRGAQPGGGDARGVVAIEQFGFANRRWGAGSTGSPVEQPSCSASIIGLATPATAGSTASIPSPVLGFVYPRRRRGAVPARGATCAAAGSASGCWPCAPTSAPPPPPGINVAQHEVRRLRASRRSSPASAAAVRVQLRLGERRPVRDPHRARVRRLRLRRRHHDGVRCGGRRPGRLRGSDPALLRGRVRDLRQLDAARRRPDPDRAPDPEPRRRRRDAVPQAPEAKRAEKRRSSSQRRTAASGGGVAAAVAGGAQR